MAKTFQCKLITPEARVLDEPVVHALVPAWDGLFGVLADHAPIVAKLGLGELRLDFAGGGGSASRSFFVDGGFVQMVDNRLTILAARATPGESLSLPDAEKELAEAERAAPSETDPARRALQAQRLNHDRERARAKVAMARRTSGRAI